MLKSQGLLPTCCLEQSGSLCSILLLRRFRQGCYTSIDAYRIWWKQRRFQLPYITMISIIKNFIIFVTDDMQTAPANNSIEKEFVHYLVSDRTKLRWCYGGGRAKEFACGVRSLRAGAADAAAASGAE
ncbi:hypothetical protein FHG87_008477 [Trinorchestia longiramus]|nr:hypothetical protein FHG87_008477 [Trinorchestia longiramus]